jgi:hypothetical protein
MALSNYDPGQELSSINFGGMLGGPLSAVVDVQAAAALSTVNFIKSVGFTHLITPLRMLFQPRFYLRSNREFHF